MRRNDLKHADSMNKPTCGEANLIRFNKVDYNSVSHAFNKAVVASYGHIRRYGFEETDDYILIPQSRRNLVLLKKKCSFSSTNRSLILSEGRIENASKVKEVCYDLRRILESPSAEVRRGIRFHERKGVCIDDYNDGPSLDLIYHSWKATKEGDGKTFRIAFNPARYRRSYELKNLGYNIYQKVVFIREHPYALINFALHEEHAYELSFLSLFANKALKLVNDQNDCIIIHCLQDLWKNFGITVSVRRVPQGSRCSRGMKQSIGL